METGVVAQGTVCRFNFQIEQVAGVVLECFFQPAESLYFVTQLEAVKSESHSNYKSLPKESVVGASASLAER